MDCLARHFFGRDGAGFAQPNDAGDVERAGAHAALVASAVDDGGNLYPRILAANIQGADAFRAVHLMGGDRHDIDVLLVHIDGNLSDSLRGVSVEDDAALAAELADFRDGLHYSDFVVRGHDGDQDGFVIHGALEFFKIDQAIFLNGQVSHAVAVFLEALAGVEHGFVLGDRGDDVVALLTVHLGYAFDGEVVALGCARGEDDFLRGGADQFGNALARRFYAFFSGPAERVVAAGGVAEFFHEIGQHLLQHAGIHGRGGVVVHINGEFHSVRNGVLCDWKLLGDLYIRAHNCFSYLICLLNA